MTDHEAGPHERKRGFIEAYRETGSVAEAMRRAGVGSRATAHRWLKRYREEGEAGLAPRSRARLTHTPTVEERSPGVAAEILRLRRLDRPGDRWGRERIARELGARFGPGAPSPAGVEAVLRRAGLWRLPPEPEPETPTAPALVPIGRPDPYELVAASQEGVRLDLYFSHTLEVARLLDLGVWRRLEADPRLAARLLIDRRFGGWLIRARLQLAHCLVDLGRHGEARRHLEALFAWMSHAEANRGFRGHEWEEEPAYRSLRWDDFWLEPQQTFLGELRGSANLDVDCARARTAIASLERKHGRRRRLINPEQSLGNLKRTLAGLEIERGRARPREILALLDAAYADTTASGDHGGMQAATLIVRAQLHGRLAGQLRRDDRAGWGAALGAMEREIGAALALVDHGGWPINLVDFTISAAVLQLEHRTGGPDAAGLERAARLCVEHGFAHQAARLLRLPGLHLLLPDLELRAALVALTRLYRAGE